MTDHPKSSDRSGFTALTSIMNGIGSLMIIAITLLICSDIIGRTFFGRPVPGVAEIVSLSILAIVFLQLGHAIQADALARTEIFQSMISGKYPRASAFLKATFYFVAALLFAALLYGSWAKLVDAWVTSEHIGVYGISAIPVWPVRVVVVLGSAVVTLQFALMTYREIVKAFGPSSKPESNIK